MFEERAAAGLQGLLGDYVHGKDADALRISVWRGDVVLRNLRLRPEALRGLGLPVSVQAGLLGELRMKVPWAALGKEPVVVGIDRVFCLVRGDAGGELLEDEAAGEAAARDARRERLAAAEKALVLRLDERMRSQDKAGGGGAGKEGGGEIEWGDDIESHHCDLIAAKYPGFHFLPRWPMAMKPFYIHHKEEEKGSTGGQLSRGFDLNYGRDEMTSGGAREHRVDVLEQNLRNMGLEPDDFTFYTDGFRYGAPPHAGWGLGVARLLMVLTGAGNVREVVLFPRDRSRVTP